MTVIITGGRWYRDMERIFTELDKLEPTLIVHGGASGADFLAKFYAQERGIPCRVFEALWEKHGRAAGPLRNEQMLSSYPDALVLAFPGGSGTRDCVRQALDGGMHVVQIGEGENATL